MDRNVTAIYRTHANAELVRQQLMTLGVSQTDIHVIPDQADRVQEGDRRDSDSHMDDLHELHLPEDDVRTYQQCVRRGDHVVSVNVDDDLVPRVREIMRRPASDLSARSTEFGREPLIGHSDPNWRMNPERAAEPDPDNADPHVRSYRRRSPLSDY
jgi:hypothetical protein